MCVVGWYGCLREMSGGVPPFTDDLDSGDAAGLVTPGGLSFHGSGGRTEVGGLFGDRGLRGRVGAHHGSTVGEKEKAAEAKEGEDGGFHGFG